jgi:hypothetical protein
MESSAARPEPTNRPPGDDFHQQRLKAWQPILTPWHVITMFIAIGIAFIPTGFHLLQESNDVRSLPPDFVLLLTSFLFLARFTNQLLRMTEVALLQIVLSHHRIKDYLVL